MQKFLLRNEWLTRNIQVLVYGHWPDATRNIRAFFTASYSESEALPVEVRRIERSRPVCLLFVGALRDWKRPLLAAEVVEELRRRGVDARLDMFGEGPERAKIEEFIRRHGLRNKVTLHGNVDAERLKDAYSRSHFLVLVSRSEGWPKAVAEAMFWGCVPLASAVSCVPEMLGQGERGDLVPADARSIAERIIWYMEHPDVYREKAQKAMTWARQYTLERFEAEIRKFLYPGEI